MGVNAVLEVVDLTVQRLTSREATAGCEVLAGINLSFRKGEILALFGETGCGKSTLINSVLGLLPEPLYVTSGRLMVTDGGNVDLLQLDERERRGYLGLKIGYVPQDVRAGLNPLMTARQTVDEGARRKGGDYRERTNVAFLNAGLPDEFVRHHANRRPGRLSGGQCQRVLIAQAIVSHPSILLLDEPTASLDPTTRTQVLKTLRSLADDGCAVCLVSHDLVAVAGIADVVAVMYLGRIVEVGTVAEVLNDPRHPYTRALLACIPRLDRKHTLQPIPGVVPATAREVVGCKFHPRCPLRETQCGRNEPPLHELQTGHQVACHVINPANHR